MKRRVYVLMSGHSSVVFDRIYDTVEELLAELPILSRPAMFGNPRFSIRIECVEA